MSIAQHHNEWLSLIDISGPFLGLKTLTEIFPQGLDNFDTAVVSELRLVYDEWADSQRGSYRPDAALHVQWVLYVLQTVLEIDERALTDVRDNCPPELQVRGGEHDIPIQPDFTVGHPSEERPRLLIQIYPERQALEKRLKQEGQTTSDADPATRMMTALRATNVPLGLLTNGEAWMLVYAPSGESATFVTWHAHLWLEERLTLRAFYSLLGNKRFFNVPDEELLSALLAEGSKAQHDVTEQLGTQVRHAVEILVQTLARVNSDSHGELLEGVDEQQLYEAALTVMMRLVFLLSAEARGLLLLGDPIYDQHYAVSTLRGQLREAADAIGEEIIERRTDAWARLLATFRAVHGGIWHEDLRLPAYGGSLFDPERFPFLEGRKSVGSEQLTVNSEEGNTDPLFTAAEGRLFTPPPPAIDNRTVLHLLEALQLLELRVGGVTMKRTLSFAALGIEQIGHVYEGLLDHQAVRAAEVIVGLNGSLEPELALAEIEAEAAKGEKQLEKYLQDETGRSSVTTIRNLLAKSAEITSHEQQLLSAVCGNDDTLYQRILPYFGLLRTDTRRMPIVILPGEVYVTAGATRRQTGTHYTPRTLTEPIVQHTLEPLVYVGPAEGLPEEEWTLKPAADILALTVCDMAMGSGAFLVQACRYLAERLVESVGQYGVNSEQLTVNSGAESSLFTPAVGRLFTVHLSPLLRELTETTDPDEQFTLAKRLVADRCLYGVDKNPLAVEMGKLSLWLITLDKNRPFTFLDHALRHGDSLVGASEEMFLRWPHGLKDSSMPLFDQEVRNLVQEARQKRQELRSFEVRDVRDAARKRELLKEAEALTARIRYGCDLLVGVHFLEDLKKRETEGVLAEALLQFNKGQPFTDPRARRAVQVAREQEALHWHFEFPEVFVNGGFSAFVGNPPFMPGGRISTRISDAYLSYLRSSFTHAGGQSDLCAYFFVRGFHYLQVQGTMGLIATNTISQGDTRDTSLGYLHDRNATIYRADSSISWQGSAAVTISTVMIIKGVYQGRYVLDGDLVQTITPMLDDMPSVLAPYKLVANSGVGFKGTDLGGIGFTLEYEEAQDLIRTDKKNIDVVFPYLGGKDFTSTHNQAPSRWVINFFDWPLEKAEGYTDCINQIRALVKPQRDKNKRKAYRERWWQHAEKRTELYSTIEDNKFVLVCSNVAKYLALAYVPNKYVLNTNLCVFSKENFGFFLCFTVQYT